MAFSSQMDDTIYLLILHQLIESVKIADIHLHKPVVGLVLYIFEVGQVAGVCQFVEVDDAIFWIFVYEKSDNM